MSVGRTGMLDVQSLWSELKDSLEAGRAEVSVGAPGRERRIQRKKPRRVGTSVFPSCEAVAGVKGRCLAPDPWVERTAVDTAC